MEIPIGHWKVASSCLCGWYGDLCPWPVSFDLRVFFKECLVFTWHAGRAWIVEVCWLQVFQDYDRALVDPKATANFCWMSMIQQTPSTKWIQHGVSSLCFLKENSKPKPWIQKELRVKLVFHEIKEVDIGTRLWSCCPLIFLKVFDLQWSESLWFWKW